MTLSPIDIIVFVAYALLILGLGLWVSYKKGSGGSEGYFLASKSLPWWAIGASLIAANISAEQMIGMSGSGFVIGLGIASYEWMAAITLVLVGKYMLPIFLEKGIYTMPQFLELRYDSRVRTSLAVFWILVYIFVNLTSVIYLGALSMETIMGIPMMYGIIGLAAFSAAYAIYGGLKAVAWTDVVQVFFLVGGGLVTTWLALAALGDGSGVMAGFTRLVGEFPEKFDMILDRSNPSYMELPGLSVLIGGMWIANISYWGCNQYIIQRALAAKSLPEAQNGLLFAAFLKLLMPLIVVIPGIVAYALSADIARPDQAYPWLLSNFVPIGLKGLTFAALIAAIASSLSSMTNSTSTIFTLDIYKNYINPAADDKQLVFVGRSVAFLALLVAVLVAPLLENFDQAFQFIQEFTGFISPGIVAIFLFGLFWKRASADGALWAAILTIPLSFLFKWLTPGIPFMNRMGIVFIIVSVVLIFISLRANKGDDSKAIAVPRSLFVTNTVFNVGSIVVSAILVVLYLLFW